MKITGPSSLTATGVGPGGKRPGGGGFSISQAEESASAGLARATGLGGVAGVDALIALQQVDQPLSRRRRAVGRANRLLDVLERLKLALLEGDPDAGELQRLAEAVREERTVTGEPELESLLDQIETRAAVEMAKLEASLKAA